MLTKRVNSLTIRRLARRTTSYVRVAVYILLVMVWWSCGMVLFGTLLSCRPVEAVWKPETGQCASHRVLVVLGRFGAISTVAADVLLVMLPVVLLWNFQMNKWKKSQMIGLVVFASM